MDFNEYQQLATRTATFDGKQKEYQMLYLTLGVAGESGELAEKIKKILRNDDGVISEEKREGVKAELGDVLWYLSQLARILDIPRSQVAKYDERGKLPLARLDMEGKRRKPWYRREDVLKVKEYLEAREEALTLAVKAAKFPGQVLEWNRTKLAFMNHAEATKTIVRREYRKGFEPVRM